MRTDAKMVPGTFFRWVGTVGGIGFHPRIPGTLASLVGWTLAWVLKPSPILLGVATLIVTLAGFWVTRPCQAIFHTEDPRQVVIDEVAGIMLALLALPHHLLWCGLALVLFRLIDMFKPFPVNWVERRTGWYGVVLDDLAAGAYTAIALQIVIHWK